jgi:chorismate mutase
LSGKKASKEIPLRDFIYLCVIVGVVLIAVVSFFLGNSDKAGGMLSFAATVVSVVLAVIAIVMTITESTNQKQSILQLKEVTQDITQQLQALRQLNESTNDAFKEVLELKENLQLQIEQVSITTTEVVTQLVNSLEKNAVEEKVSVKKVKEIVDELKDKKVRYEGVYNNSGIFGGIGGPYLSSTVVTEPSFTWSIDRKINFQKEKSDENN